MKKLSVAEKFALIFITAITWFALVLQWVIIMLDPVVGGTTMVQKIGHFFSFFTILTNLIVAFGTTARLFATQTATGRFFSKPAVQTAMNIYIVFVGISYNLLLRHLWNPQGWQRVADELLHTVIPILYCIYWFCFVPKGILKWKNMLSWFIYPLLYIPYALIRGKVTGAYAYPFIDVNKIGAQQVAINVVFLIIAFIVLSVIFKITDSVLGKNRK